MHMPQAGDTCDGQLKNSVGTDDQGGAEKRRPLTKAEPQLNCSDSMHTQHNAMPRHTGTGKGLGPLARPGGGLRHVPIAQNPQKFSLSIHKNCIKIDGD